MYYFEHGNATGVIMGHGAKWMIFRDSSGKLLHDGRRFPSRAAALAEVKRW
ncbi:hypothetical protein V5F49_05020 [Xanthobacter sp. V3C-3]|uniref:hypothetical protein n=1 Tax=Xanthobacter lutulentifluminis TaxID=3119935 RepID=UPI003727CFB8